MNEFKRDLLIEAVVGPKGWIDRRGRTRRFQFAKVTFSTKISKTEISV